MYLDVPEPEYLEERCTNGTTEDDCWIWNLAKDKDGYGHLKWHGQMTKAHRVSFTVYCGDIPDGYVVCHSCDNPPCINPRHLFVGTDQDNADDSVAKNRRAVGSKNGMTTLTEEDVVVIRELMAGSAYYKDVQEQFGISTAALFKITTGAYWAHVGGPITQRSKR